MRGAGVSGDTTAGGLGRVDFSVQGDTDLAVVELGANDLLQGVDPKAVQANLDHAILRRLKVPAHSGAAGRHEGAAADQRRLRPGRLDAASSRRVPGAGGAVLNILRIRSRASPGMRGCCSYDAVHPPIRPA